MKQSEVQIAIDWARQEGWNPGLHDAQCFYEADPNGFFIETLNEEIVGVGSAVAYDEHFGFCGLYIVKEACRHHGYGMKMTQERLKYLDDRIVGIDGVIENISKYKKIGYVSAHKNIRYELVKLPSIIGHANVIELSDISLQQLEMFDRRYFPAKRTRFLSAWINQPGSYALGYADPFLQGYGVIRKCFKGYKIGPLFADSFDIAKKLFESLCSKIQDGPIYLDVPENNPEAIKLVQEYGMAPSFKVMRMYRNGCPSFDISGVYGITTFELG